MPRRYTDAERVAAFWAKVTRSAGCWLWTGAQGRGYGRVKVGGKLRAAHVVAWEQFNGPVPTGTELDHRCYVRLCVRPSHLIPKTPTRNASEGGKRNQYGKDKCKNGHTFDRVWMQNGKPTRRCSACNRRSKRG